MVVLRNTEWVEAPASTVGAVLRDPSTVVRALAETGVEVALPAEVGRLLVPGDELFLRGPVRAAMRLRIVAADAGGLRAVLESQELRADTVLTEVDGRTRMTDEVRWTSPFVSDDVTRASVRRILRRRTKLVHEVSEAWVHRRVVVGAAVVHNGRLLAQQREFPAAHAGRWELPGGRVEPGESESAAIVRECKEELDVHVEPVTTGDGTSVIGTDVALDPDSVLRIHRARLVDTTATPRAVEHRQLRWVDAEELGTLDWLEADRVLLHSLHALLD